MKNRAMLEENECKFGLEKLIAEASVFGYLGMDIRYLNIAFGRKEEY